MTTIEHLDKDEQKHFIRCGCGHFIDMRNLAQVFLHQHEYNSLPEPQWKGCSAIEHPDISFRTSGEIS